MGASEGERGERLVMTLLGARRRLVLSGTYFWPRSKREVLVLK